MDFFFTEKTSLIFWKWVTIQNRSRTERQGNFPCGNFDRFLLGKSDICRRLEENLSDHGVEWKKDTSVKPNPRDLDCRVSADGALQFDAQAIVALGGGSAMDQGKAAAALCTNGGIVQDWEDRPLNKTPLTLFCIPTTQVPAVKLLL